MWTVIGWLCLAGALAAVVGAAWCMSRGERGPYGDVLPPSMRTPPPREWYWTYVGLAVACTAVAGGLLLLGARLLPNVAWLDRVRVFH